MEVAMLKPISTLILLLLAYPCCAQSEPIFHTAKSNPEKALHAILIREYTTNAMSNYLLRANAAPDDVVYEKLFTAAYKQSVLKLHNELCSKGSPEECIMNSPISCTAEGAEDGYVYQTIKDGNSESILAFTWLGESEETARYRMVKENDIWKIDGVTCGGEHGLKFNM